MSSESQFFLVTSLIFLLRVSRAKWYHSWRILGVELLGGRGVGCGVWGCGVGVYVGGWCMGTPVSSRTINNGIYCPQWVWHLLAIYPVMAKRQQRKCSRHQPLKWDIKQNFKITATSSWGGDVVNELYGRSDMIHSESAISITSVS